MNPAYSVILFTTASGAGLGLLIWLAAIAFFGPAQVDPGFGFWAFGLAFVLLTGGLLTSTLHLGHPERAAKALTQWRSSWLSREGIAALAVYPFAGLLAIGWVLFGSAGAFWTLAGLIGAVAAVATLVCTGMIYQSLPTIPAWSKAIVTPVYVLLALLTGGLIALFLVRVYGGEARNFAWLLIVVAAIGAAAKWFYWRQIDSDRPVDMGRATGLGRFGDVRVLEAPHTVPNFVMREMGFQVGRKHADMLRRLVMVALFLVPAVMLVFSLLISGSAAHVVFTLIAVISASIGVIVERWLFFAEARHISASFYTASVR